MELQFFAYWTWTRQFLAVMVWSFLSQGNTVYYSELSFLVQKLFSSALFMTVILTDSLNIPCNDNDCIIHLKRYFSSMLSAWSMSYTKMVLCMVLKYANILFSMKIMVCFFFSKIILLLFTWFLINLCSSCTESNKAMKLDRISLVTIRKVCDWFHSSLLCTFLILNEWPTVFLPLFFHKTLCWSECLWCLTQVDFLLWQFLGILD